MAPNPLFPSRGTAPPAAPRRVVKLSETDLDRALAIGVEPGTSK
ncbi:hypothetical protein ACFYPC_24375 [Streptomyces sp. NPDC005808]